MTAPARLKVDGKTTLQSALDEAGKSLPGCTLAVANADGILFSGSTGAFDVLNPSRKLSAHDAMWFASTTKLLTSICYLQLVDRGVLTLDTDMRKLFPPLDAAASRIIKGFNDGQPEYEAYAGPVTLLSLLNQTSGFGKEFGETVQEWKKTATKGAGFVNSCKIDNLINTPLCFTPGTAYEYGNSAEWLGLMLPSIAGVETEEYFQENVVKPLGLKSTTFYPFGGDWDDKLMPLRFRSEDGEYAVLKDQLPLLTLPRKREEIEYPVAGGGIYSCSADYVVVLQNLLQHYLSLSGKSERPATVLLSDKSIASLFAPTLPDAGKKAMAEMLSVVRGVPTAEAEADWSTGMSVYLGPKVEGGRSTGTVGWGGAAGTSYLIDPEAGIAVVSSSQVLPGGAAGEFGKAVEKAVYAALE